MSRGYWDTSRARQLWGWQFGFYVCRGITRGRWVDIQLREALTCGQP